MPATRRWQRLSALPLLIVLALAATLLLAGPAEAQTERERKIAHAYQVAINQQGDPYVYGADGPNAFDCSGLTKYSFGKAGLYLPRSSDSQWRYVRHIKRENAQRGDFVFFYNSSGVYHRGLFAGRVDGVPLMWHAPHSGTVVRRDKIWTSRWLAGTLRL